MDANTTAQEIVEIARKARPGVVYRAASDGASVAAWCEGRWIPVAGKTIIPTYPWVSIEYEMLVDGKPAFDQTLYGPAPGGTYP